MIVNEWPVLHRSCELTRLPVVFLRGTTLYRVHRRSRSFVDCFVTSSLVARPDNGRRRWERGNGPRSALPNVRASIFWFHLLKRSIQYDWWTFQREGAEPGSPGKASG